MDENQKIKEIIKFDVGADGFQKMIYVLAIGSVVVLIAGAIFLTIFMRDVRQIS